MHLSSVWRCYSIIFPHFLLLMRSMLFTHFGTNLKILNCGAGENSWVPWTARRSNQSILKEISPEYSLEGLMLKLKLQSFGHLMRRTDSLEKDPDAGKDWKQEEKGMTEDEMVGWHHRLDGHEFEQAPGAGDGQGSLACCGPWGHKESDTTEGLNWCCLPNCFTWVSKLSFLSLQFYFWLCVVLMGV